MMSGPDLEQLIAAWLDGRIAQSESDLLQQRLRESADARVTFRRYVELDSSLRTLAGGELGSANGSPRLSGGIAISSDFTSLPSSPFRLGQFVKFACAAVILLVVGGVAYMRGNRDASWSTETRIAANTDPGLESIPVEGLIAERKIAGYATLRRTAGVRWSNTANAHLVGDVLDAGILEFEDGLLEIDFFCGATIVVEGPAKMDLESDWSVRLLAGRLRANVPPAARGFVVKAADSEIVDLGTEFALEVDPENVQVKVVDGEVVLRGGQHDGEHLVTGESQALMGRDVYEGVFEDLSTADDVQQQHEREQRQRFSEWETYSRQLRMDKRLIAYYPIAESIANRFVSNAALTGSDRDGILVGSVNHSQGRFGSTSAGLDFSRTGARVRTRIDGEFQTLTFACWVRIDSLDHLYNSLFMSDGYENGEPHWQIRDDGCLMFSVMVDDAQEIEYRSPVDHQVIKDAGLHKVYLTQPIWNASNSGQWFHIVAVYDPIGRRVDQYVNGVKLSSSKIAEKYHVTKLRIGRSEIGNWGQPFRDSPWFSVRNLNGVVDELAIFDSPLSKEEIRELYERGKPVGY